MKRFAAILMTLGLLPWLMAAQFATRNFVCEASSPQAAQQIAEAAESARRTVAIAWLNHPLDDWPEKCPIRANIRANPPGVTSSGGGATSFGFDRGRVLGRHMTIEGPLDRLCVAVVPHEVTHTVFADIFGAPTPRCFDEGAAVCSEDDQEFRRHDKLCREILNTPGRMIPLKRLFALTEYPSDVMSLYAEGYCVTSWLIGLKGRPKFLQFVSHGMQRGFDEAVRIYYDAQDVNDLERSWLAHMKSSKPTAGGGSGETRPVTASGPAAGAASGDARTSVPVTVPSGNSDKVLSLILQSQQAQADALKLLAANDKLQDQRLDRLERQVMPQQQPSSWNDAPQRTAPNVQPYQPGRFAQPMPAPPSGRYFVPSGMPFCPPGGT